jgi:hypothetical protein
MRSKEPKTVSEELLIIKKKNGGLLDPAKVVDYARDPDTALHARFEWDDSKAAEGYRIWQARQVIRMELVVISQDDNGKISTFSDIKEEAGKIVRTYVSLGSDRRPEEGERGYRSLIDVLSDAEMREQMLEEAKKDMNVFRRKYGALSELAKVFAAMDEIA